MHRKKVVGMILLLTGITLIALGLVIGFVAPNMVLKKVEESICVNSKDSPGYKRLVSEICVSSMIEILPSATLKR